MAQAEAESENRQIQRSDGGSYPLARQVRQRGLAGQTSIVLLQPAAFFRTLPPMDITRQWLWIGLLVLALIGTSAVLQAQRADEGGGSTSVAPSVPGGGSFDDGSGLPEDFFGAPPPGVGTPGPTTTGGNAMDTRESLTTVVLSAATVVLVWAGQTVLLSEVSLFNGRAPRLGRNFQIAVWASLPLGLMALLQIIYMLLDGSIGEPGLSGLLVEADFYAGQTAFVQSLMLALASTLTLPWLWSLALVYFGARYALNGKWWSSLLVVVLWLVVMTVVPVISGEIDAADRAPVEANGDEAELPGIGGDEDVVPPFSLRDLEEGGGTFPGVDIPGLGAPDEGDEGFTVPEEGAPAVIPPEPTTPDIEPTPTGTSDDAEDADTGQ